MDVANKQGGGGENRRYENGEERWREKWESGKKLRVQRLEERVEKGAKEGERQEADRAEEFPGKKGRVD